MGTAIVLIVLLVVIVGGGLYLAQSRAAAKRQQLEDAKADARRLVERLGGQVLNLTGSVKYSDADRTEIQRQLTEQYLGDYTATREELLERGPSVLGDLAAGRLELEIGGHYPLEGAAAAYDDLEARRTTGKLILVP